MKVSFDLKSTLYKKTVENGKKYGRSFAAETRFQLKEAYGVKE